MSAISDRVVALSKPYFGPATEKFLVRQCTAHLNIDMTNLTTSHLRDLAHWVQIGGSLIMDPAKAQDISKKIAALAG